MAGQVIMQGFVGFTIPLWLRRVLTMLPTFIIVALGIDPTQTLVISQVILSLVLPMPIIALIYFTRRRDIMGSPYKQTSCYNTRYRLCCRHRSTQCVAHLPNTWWTNAILTGRRRNEGVN